MLRLLALLAVELAIIGGALLAGNAVKRWEKRR